MVLRNHLDCIVKLLSYEADADLQDAEGNTPLHLAVKSVKISLVHTLIAFGANINLLNNKGETARHLAASDTKGEVGDILYTLDATGAKRCLVPMQSCQEGCGERGQFNGLPPENCIFSKTNETVFEELLMSVGVNAHKSSSSASAAGCLTRKKLHILCLDGGGIRGLVLIQILYEMERIIRRPINQFFDLIAGTSTGGILAMLLATGKSIKECICLYLRLKDKVFAGDRPYNTDFLESFLKTELGESTVMGDIKRQRLMITATRGDRKPADLHIFRNYKSPLEIMNLDGKDALTNEVSPNPRDQLLWQAARATGAAPTYFRPSGPYIDGGLISNNPTLDAITEIHQCNQAHIAMGEEEEVCEIKVVVSLGTGKPPLKAVETIDVFRPDSLWNACRAALGVANLGQLLIDQATQTDGRVTARAQAVCHMMSIPYFRLNPQLGEDVALDEKNLTTIVKMLWETTAYMRSKQSELELLKGLLVA